ncbi:MAG TPA: condensation domain-containing protein, partial [Kribbella sp.]
AASGAYVNQVQLRLSGVADPEALATAWQRVVDRTAVLRSRIVWEAVPQPLQLVQRRAVVPITRLDWSDLPEPARQAELDRLLDADRAEGVDLTVAPLLRLVIARLSDTEVLVVWTMHHVLLDGWSAAQVFDEVCEQYAAIVAGRRPELVARRPFREYLQWLGEQERSEAEAFWRDALSGLDTPTALPYDHAPVEAHRTESTAAIQVTLPTDRTDQLRHTAQHHGLTFNTVVQGAWALLLSRYSGQDDVVFGTTVSGRPADLHGVEWMVGMFINTVPTRVRVPGREPLTSWLAELQAAQSEARRYDYLALAQLQTLSDLPAGSHLFDSIVVFENYPIDDQSAAKHGLELTDTETFEPTNYPLTLVVLPGRRLSITLDYDPRLFDRATVEQLAGRLRFLLEGIAEDADRAVWDLPMLTEAESRRVLVEWNDTGCAVPDVTVPGLFEAQVARTPQAVAVTCGDLWLSYAELNAQANRLARVLIDHGAGPERFVALALPRSIDLVVAVLAVLKAGAGYLPVDPSYPAERVSFMLADARPALVVTTAEVAARLPVVAGVGVLVLDESPEALAETVPGAVSGAGCSDLTDAERVTALSSEHPAYVIYTSGSTGVPKGVVVAQHSVVAFAAWAAAEFGADGLSRVVASTSLNFDVSVFEILCPLMAGGRVEVVRDVLALADRPADAPMVASLVSAVPSAFAQVVAQGLAGVTADTVVLAGEALSARAVREIRVALPG